MGHLAYRLSRVILCDALEVHGAILAQATVRGRQDEVGAHHPLAVLFELFGVNVDCSDVLDQAVE